MEGDVGGEQKAWAQALLSESFYVFAAIASTRKIDAHYAVVAFSKLYYIQMTLTVFNV
jgi:hypothetical protein